MEVSTYPLAYQSNVLVRSPLRLNHLEARIFALALGCIHQKHETLPQIRFSIAHLLTTTRSGNAYRLIAEACKSLGNKTLWLEWKSGTNQQRNRVQTIVDFLEIDRGTGTITGAFSPSVAPHLLQLMEHYTKVEIEQLLELKSAHAHRLYWLLTSYKSEGGWEVKVADLRMQVLNNLEEYPLLQDFRRYVLDKALEEFHALGWRVTYVPVKVGRKVEKIHFTIPKAPGAAKADKNTIATEISSEARKPGKKQLSAATTPGADSNLPAATSLDQKVVRRLTKLKMTPAQIQKVLAYIGEDEAQITKLMKATHPLLRDFEAGNKQFDNLGGATINLLKTEFPGLYPVMK